MSALNVRLAGDQLRPSPALGIGRNGKKLTHIERFNVFCLSRSGRMVLSWGAHRTRTHLCNAREPGPHFGFLPVLEQKTTERG
jgi:hypothetical protein